VKALNSLAGLEVSFVSLVHRAAVRDPSNPTEPMRFALTKGEQPVIDLTASGAPTKPEGGHMPKTEAELRAALEKAEAANQQLREELAKSASTKPDKKGSKKPKGAKPDPAAPNAPEGENDDPNAPEGGDKMTKSEEIAKAEERIQKAEQRAEAAEKIAKEERDLRVRGEFVELAKSDLEHLGDSTEIGAELHRLSEVLAKEEFDKHLERQRAANEQIAKGDLFRQIGQDGSPTASTADDMAKAKEKASELRKSDSNLSDFDAMAQVIRDNPELVLNNR
jgi:hypothetical protein